MITISDTRVFGWEAAICGMRNPLNSWDKSDSGYYDEDGGFVIGDADLKLMETLSHSGPDHAKFLRFINVTCDIVAPLYWWKQFDTYRVGVEKNSCSTMHRIHAKEFTMDDFSTDHMDDGDIDLMWVIICNLNEHRKLFIESKDKEEWYHMIQLLPECYNQKRTVQMSYAAVKAMYHARKNHKLDEWRRFCEWAETLPKFKEICI